MKNLMDDKIKDPMAYRNARCSPYWQELKNLAAQTWSLAALFEQDDSRGMRFSMQAGALYMDARATFDQFSPAAMRLQLRAHQEALQGFAMAGGRAEAMLSPSPSFWPAAMAHTGGLLPGWRHMGHALHQHAGVPGPGGDSL